jgi:hypothetical protein
VTGPTPFLARSFSGAGEAVTVPGRLLGYRAWRLVPVLAGAEPRTAPAQDPENPVALPPVEPGRFRLQATVHRTVWPLPGRMSAACLTNPDSPERHDAPVDDCACGIYGWYAPAHAHQYDTAPVVGVIEATGRVLMGTKGFRCERARVRALVVRALPVGALGMSPSVATPLWEQFLADCRDAGVVLFGSEEEMLRAFPPSDVSALIGPLPEPEVDLRGDPGVLLTSKWITPEMAATLRRRWMVSDQMLAALAVTAELRGAAPLNAWIDSAGVLNAEWRSVSRARRVTGQALRAVGRFLRWRYLPEAWLFVAVGFSVARGQFLATFVDDPVARVLWLDGIGLLLGVYASRWRTARRRAGRHQGPA